MGSCSLTFGCVFYSVVSTSHNKCCAGAADDDAQRNMPPSSGPTDKGAGISCNTLNHSPYEPELDQGDKEVQEEQAGPSGKRITTASAKTRKPVTRGTKAKRKQLEVPLLALTTLIKGWTEACFKKVLDFDKANLPGCMLSHLLDITHIQLQWAITAVTYKLRRSFSLSAAQS